MKILIVDTFYGPYLQRLYGSGELIQQPWAVQHKAHFEGGFGTGDAYSHWLGLLGVEAIEIVANSMPATGLAQEHRPELLQLQDAGQQLLAILEAQILAGLKPQFCMCKTSTGFRPPSPACEATGGDGGRPKRLPSGAHARFKPLRPAAHLVTALRGQIPSHGGKSHLFPDWV